MGAGKVVIRIAFRGLGDDEVLDPAPALEDIVSILDHHQPLAFCFVELIEEPAVTIELMADFGPGGAAKAENLLTALVRAEGEAGFHATFLPDREPKADWGFAELRLGDLALPSGIPFALPAPVSGVEAEIARALRLTTRGFGGAIYGVRRGASSELARSLVRPLAETEGSGGEADRVAAALRDAMGLAATDGWSVREGVCLHARASDADAALVETVLVAQARRLFPFLPADIGQADWGPLDALAAPLPAGSFEERLPLVRDGDYMRRALVGMLKHARAQSRPPGRTSRAAPATPRPAPSGGYVFLSYAHRDADLALAAKARLEQIGVRIWHDSDLGAAQVWDEYLEQRVRGAAGLIACLSPNYGSSRYCRREIKFADLLAKPIVPISLDGRCLWSEGLEMRFHEYQILNSYDPTWTESVLRHLREHAPACLGQGLRV
jgi:hypothetical protein